MGSADEITPEKLAEEIRKLKIEDLVLSTISTLGQLAYTKLEAKDFDQARLAIDAAAALLPTLEGHVDADVLRDFKQLVANMRMAFTSAVSASGSEPGAPEPSERGPLAATGDEVETEPREDSASASEPQSADAENRGDGSG